MSDLSPLSALDSLNTLYLENNDITRIDGIFDNFRNAHIDLSGNPLLCAEIDAYRANPVESVSLQFRISDNASVSVEIYNLAGQVVYQIPDRSYTPGDYTVNWTGGNGNWNPMPGSHISSKVKVFKPFGL